MVYEPRRGGKTFFYDIKKKNPEDFPVSEGGEYLKNNIYGRLSYMLQVKGGEDPTFLKLAMKMGQHDPAPPKYIKEIKRRVDMYQVFICHASEDKEKIARPLYDAMLEEGLAVFLDEKEIEWGDSLVEKINKALVSSTVVVAVVSNNSIGKAWPEREIYSIIDREIKGKSKLLFLLDGEGEKLMGNYGIVQDKLYRNWEDNPEELASAVKRIVESNG